MPKIKEMLDWQIHFNQDGGDKVLPFYWADEKGEIYNDRPLTLRTVYQELKRVLEPSIPDKEEVIIKSEFKQGHRKRMFNDEDVEEIKKLYATGISKNQIAKIKGCSEKTIRNYLKQ
ncbi:MAG: helix-turn-helix domain-containing protein [Peptostreptococcaceae bacterium]|uniref:helix-turn-helix domain-containing protein n=1 Tax=Clostridium sp. TaxID=1506 RepID=UPI00290A0491|nr:helix-turn-helix domain-containing protein [Clostridium sp.]MDU6274084.1 helix-turn-helix domain-containing protein [Clostridium sp.]MDU7535743.1 helix-turn-helix domain-containing protein [Peptostreptococcaceae bacterium]